jgi:hypothetical protein
MAIYSIEILLFILSFAIWLGPLSLAVWRRTVTLIHPSVYFPVFLMFTVSVAMTEHWFGWSLRSVTPGLRFETRLYQDLPFFYILPLLILTLSGLAFHYGVYKGSGHAVAGEIDRIHLTARFPAVKASKIPLLWSMFLLSVFCITPFALLGQDRGYFWTLGPLYAFSLLPVLVMSQWRTAGYLLWFMGLPAMLLLDSKGNFIYHVLPIVLFYQGSLFYKGKRFKPLNLMFLIIFLAIVALGTKYLTIRRGEYVEDLPVIFNIVVREYGFEVFAVLVQKISWFGQFYKESWLGLELTELIPSVLLPWTKIRAGVQVANVFLPTDYVYMMEAGFNRFFVFAAYHDLGWLGAVGYSFMVGWLFGKLYCFALKRTYREKVLWPLVAWLPVPLFAQYTSIGNLAFFIIFSGFGVLAVFLFKIFARMRVVYN